MIREDVATRYILDLWEQTHAVETIKIKLARRFHHDISSSEIIAILETYKDILTDIPETFEKPTASTISAVQKIDP